MLEVEVGGDCDLVGGEHGCDGVSGGVLHGGAGGFGEPRVRLVAVELDDVGGGGPRVRQGLPDGTAQLFGVEVGGVCAWGELRGAGVAAVLVGAVGDASGCFGAGAVAVENEGVSFPPFRGDMLYKEELCPDHEEISTGSSAMGLFGSSKRPAGRPPLPPAPGSNEGSMGTTAIG